MARLLSPSALPLLRKPARAENAQLEKSAPPASAFAPVSIAQMWRESLQTFSAHSGVMLCASLCLLSPFLAGHWIATQAALQNMAWVGPVPTLQEKLPPATLIMLALLSWPANTLARGVITWLALKDSAGGVSRNFWSCLPALLAGNLLHSALVSICLLGLSLSVQGIDMHWIAGHLVPAQMLKTDDELPIQESIRVSLLEAGPFAMLLPDAQTALLRRPALTAYESSLINAGKMPAPRSLIEQSQSTHPQEWLAFTALCIVLLVLTEMLLRFRTVMAFKPLESFPISSMKLGGERLQRFAALSPLIDSARFALKHFGAIALHISVLRAATSALVVLLVMLPSAAAAQFATPALISLIGKTPLLPVLSFVQLGLAAFIAAIVLAFNTIYDARLFAALHKVAD